MSEWNYYVNDKAYEAFKKLLDKCPNALELYKKYLFSKNEHDGYIPECFDEWLSLNFDSFENGFDKWLEEFDIGDYGEYFQKYYDMPFCGFYFCDFVDYDENGNPIEPA